MKDDLVNVTAIPFHLMPEAFKRAVSHYFSVEGDIEPEVVEGREYGITKISMDKLTQSIMEDDGIKGRFKDFQAYHERYTGNGSMDTSDYTEIWPVLLSDLDDETLHDGWHRLHCYYAAGVKQVPVIAFVQEPKLESAFSMDFG